MSCFKNVIETQPRWERLFNLHVYVTQAIYNDMSPDLWGLTYEANIKGGWQIVLQRILYEDNFYSGPFNYLYLTLYSKSLICKRREKNDWDSQLKQVLNVINNHLAWLYLPLIFYISVFLLLLYTFRTLLIMVIHNFRPL